MFPKEKYHLDILTKGSQRTNSLEALKLIGNCLEKDVSQRKVKGMEHTWFAALKLWGKETMMVIIIYQGLLMCDVLFFNP